MADPASGRVGYFGLVVDVVDEHGGWVNKFEGDAALAVFGAPIPLEQAPSAALGAARELADRLPPEGERWRLDGTVTLRGRGEQTRLAEPVLDD